MHTLLRYISPAILALVCLFCQRPVQAPPQPAAQGMNEEQKNLLMASFEEVWTTVKDRHYDPDLGGLDWQHVYEQYRPRIDKANSNDEGRNIMNEMLGLLKQTHIGVIPASSYKDLHGESRGDHHPGLDIRVLGGRAIVTQIEAGSPAAKVGVVPGWEVLKIDGKPVEPIIKRVEGNYSESTLKDAMAVRALLGALSGQSSEAVEIEFNDGSAIKTLRLDRVEPRGTKIAFGNMPAESFWVETSSTKDDIRVIRFNIWLNPPAVAEAFSEIMKDPESARGFVIDLRGNPGGIGAMAMGAAGWFTGGKGLKLGTLIMRGATLNYIISPRPNAVDAPLAILIDGCSASTSEIFAGGMQDIRRARIFGTRTAGAALPSAFVRLPNGDGFQYILANYISEGGKPLEGLGVTPDEIMEPSQKELLAGKDTVFDRAVAWILKSRK